MVILLLPGMDGTGIMLQPFVQLLPDCMDVRVIRYPENTYLNYAQLSQHVLNVAPLDEPYLIIAESYSGPVAILLASHAVGNLQAVIFVSSFVSRPLGHIGVLIAKMIPSVVFRLRTPTWILRWFLMDAATPSALITSAQDAIARVTPEVLAQRLRDALTADYEATLSDCSVRMVYVLPAADRLLGLRGLRGFLAVKPDIETVKIPGPHFLLQCAPASSLAALEGLGLLNKA